MWRRVIVKRGLQKLFLEHGQCGERICGVTGGVRAHTPVFGVLTSHGGEAVAVLNLDLCNCCLSVFGVAGR